MSNQQAGRGAGRAGLNGQIPRGETVASYETYEAAQQAIDRLAAADFPVKQLSIVGDGLKSVERVTGKLSYGRAAAGGALSGAWMGLFFGLLLVIVNPASSLVFVGAAILIGAAFGMMFTIVTYSINRRRRDFTSVMQVLATSYTVIVSPELANRARNILSQPEGSADRPSASGPF